MYYIYTYIPSCDEPKDQFSKELGNMKNTRRNNTDTKSKSTSPSLNLVSSTRRGPQGPQAARAYFRMWLSQPGLQLQS